MSWHLDGKLIKLLIDVCLKKKIRNFTCANNVEQDYENKKLVIIKFSS